MGHYRSEMLEDFSGLSEQEKLAREVKNYFEQQKRTTLISRNGVRVSKGSGGRLLFTPITDEEARKKIRH